MLRVSDQKQDDERKMKTEETGLGKVGCESSPHMNTNHLQHYRTELEPKWLRTDRQAGRQTDRQAGRQSGRQTGRQADRQAGKQARTIPQISFIPTQAQMFDR